MNCYLCTILYQLLFKGCCGNWNSHSPRISSIQQGLMAYNYFLMANFSATKWCRWHQEIAHFCWLLRRKLYNHYPGNWFRMIPVWSNLMEITLVWRCMTIYMDEIIIDIIKKYEDLFCKTNDCSKLHKSRVAHKMHAIINKS